MPKLLFAKHLLQSYKAFTVKSKNKNKQFGIEIVSVIVYCHFIEKTVKLAVLPFLKRPHTAPE